MTRVCPAGTETAVGSPKPPLPVSPKGTFGTNWTGLALEFLAEVECGLIIAPAVASPIKTAANVKWVLNFFILVSPLFIEIEFIEFEDYFTVRPTEVTCAGLRSRLFTLINAKNRERLAHKRIVNQIPQTFHLSRIDTTLKGAPAGQGCPTRLTPAQTRRNLDSKPRLWISSKKSCACDAPASAAP